MLSGITHKNNHDVSDENQVYSLGICWILPN